MGKNGKIGTLMAFKTANAVAINGVMSLRTLQAEGYSTR